MSSFRFNGGFGRYEKGSVREEAESSSNESPDEKITIIKLFIFI